MTYLNLKVTHLDDPVLIEVEGLMDANQDMKTTFNG